MNLRWYKDQIEGLPPESRKRLQQHLRRTIRTGDPPTKREWRTAVQRSLRPYRAAYH